MLTIGPVVIGAPWVLLGLVLVPVAWWLMRASPFAGRIEDVSPHWLIAVRLFALALIVFALAKPVYNPSRNLTNAGPLVLLIDNGWASAPRWDGKRAAARNLIEQAARDARAVYVIPTAARATGDPREPARALTPKEALAALARIEPRPWPVGRLDALALLEGLPSDPRPHLAWLSDGLDNGEAREFAVRLKSFGAVELFSEDADDLPAALLPIEATTYGFDVRLARAPSRTSHFYWVRVLDAESRLLARANVTTKPDDHLGGARIDLPLELRNRSARIEIEGVAHAAAIGLLDERSRRRSVGLVPGERLTDTLPPTDGVGPTDLYFLERALKPFSETTAGSIAKALESDASLIVIADAGPFPPQAMADLTRFVASGGVLVQFAGPRFIEHGGALLPVRLHREARNRIADDREAPAWREPMALGAFTPASPFQGLEIPIDVKVVRQVLAEPSPLLDEASWAVLSDGTPLVTAQHLGKGWLVLFHTTGTTEWSNLAASRLFADMMQRLVGISGGLSASAGDAAAFSALEDAEVQLEPVANLTASGALGGPLPQARPIALRSSLNARAGPDHPPGYYEGAGTRRALNLMSENGPIAADFRLRAIADLPGGVILSRYASVRETDLRQSFLLIALALGLVDLGLSLWLGARRKSALLRE